MLLIWSSVVALLASLTRFLPWTGARQPPYLQFSDYYFKIAIFSDLHFGEDEHSFGPAQDSKSQQLMDYILEVERPHLAVLNGDLITGENTFAHNSSSYIHRIVEPLVRRKVQWASTYGNHDSSFNLSRTDLLREEQKYDLSLTQQGPEAETEGVTNYMLPLYTQSDWPSNREPPYQEMQPFAFFHFLDSRGSVGRGSEPEIPDYVSVRTTKWFRNATAEARKRWGDLPSLAFVHIPPPSFLDLQQDKLAKVSGPHYPGMNDDVPVAQQGSGDEAQPFMQALLDTPLLHSVYSGHDHGNSWCGRWPNDTAPGKMPTRPFLCFGKHSGFGGYGDWKRGARIVEIIQGDYDNPGHMIVNTWVRLQDGSIVTNVRLNENYGLDQYPVDDGGYRHPHQDPRRT